MLARFAEHHFWRVRQSYGEPGSVFGLERQNDLAKSMTTSFLLRY